jgi:ribonuclease HI
MGVGIAVRTVEEEQVTDTVSKNCGRGTNNQAEYLAVIEACRYVRDHYDYEKLTVYTDSQLVFRQLKGEYKVKDKRLKKLHGRAVEEMKASRAHLRWHSREDGDGPRADKLANRAGGKHGTRH